MNGEMFQQVKGGDQEEIGEEEKELRWQNTESLLESKIGHVGSEINNQR